MTGFFPIKIDASLELRVLHQEHASDLFDLVDANRPHLSQWLPFVESYHSVSAARDFIEKFHQQTANKEGFALGTWHNGSLAGVITYDYIEWDNRATLIGYWLGEKFQGKGLVTRACSALVNLAFKDLGLNRVEIDCASGNTKCRAVPERLGFKKEGVLRQRERVNDHFVDIVVYSMLAEDWAEAVKAPARKVWDADASLSASK